MPELTRMPISELGQLDILNDALFFCSGSYEQRSTSIPLAIPPEIIARAYVCYNSDHIRRVGSHVSMIVNHFGLRCSKVPLNSGNPVLTADKLAGAVEGTGRQSNRKFVVDPTTFTHEGLLILLRVLASRMWPSDKLYLVYTPASEYAVGLQPNEKWLSRGIQEIRSVLGYSGLMLPNRPTHLVVLVGFESDRAQMLIDAYEPAAVSLGVGSDATDQQSSHLALNVATLRRLAANYKRYHEFRFSSTNFIETQAALEKQIAVFPNHNVVIAPMNTKLSTVGAALCGMANPEVQLSYARAHTYNISGYSAPSENCIVSEISRDSLPATSDE